jgi:hypothetical protein
VEMVRDMLKEDLEAYDTANPEPTSRDHEPKEGTYGKWADARCGVITKTIKEAGKPPIWIAGKAYTFDGYLLTYDDADHLRATYQMVPSYVKPLPECPRCGATKYDGQPTVCAVCIYDDEAKKRPLGKHQTCHYCKLSHRHVEAGGLHSCPNRLCPGCGASGFREQMKLKSYKDVEGGKYTLDPVELVQYVRDNPHRYPEVGEYELKFVDFWLTGKEPT